MTALKLISAQSAKTLSILEDEFQLKLSAFNDVTRSMRTAGIEICHLMLADHRIFIQSDSVEQFLRCFGHELRGVSYVTQGRFTCSSMRVRGVEVTWVSQVKEQDHD